MTSHTSGVHSVVRDAKSAWVLFIGLLAPTCTSSSCWPSVCCMHQTHTFSSPNIAVLTPHLYTMQAYSARDDAAPEPASTVHETITFFTAEGIVRIPGRLVTVPRRTKRLQQPMPSWEEQTLCIGQTFEVAAWNARWGCSGCSDWPPHSPLCCSWATATVAVIKNHRSTGRITHKMQVAQQQRLQLIVKLQHHTHCTAGPACTLQGPQQVCQLRGACGTLHWHARVAQTPIHTPLPPCVGCAAGTPTDVSASWASASLLTCCTSRLRRQS